MTTLHGKEHQIALGELRKLGIRPKADSVVYSKGPIETDTPNGLKFVVRTSAGANEPRRWDAGQFKQENFSDSSFYLFINRWRDESKSYELFVIPSRIIQKVVNWKASRPKFNMQEGQDRKFKNNWEPVLSLLKSNMAGQNGVCFL